MISASALSQESPFTADRRFDACPFQPLGVADAQVLLAPVRRVDQIVGRRLALVQSLLQCIQNKVGLYVAAHSTTHDATGKHIDDKGHV